ncbi:MAG: hypothetical protein IPP82_17785 [Xanthomonadales bacterium]|nr:hypothetical protein [Xanthomonadales bacterium]
MNIASSGTTRSYPSLDFSPTLLRCAALALLTLVGLASAPAQAAIPPSERQVLIDLYTSTNGASWDNATGWLSAVGSECTWVGVTCDGAEAHVYQIDLGHDNLAGPLPPLAGLTNLVYFYVHNNQLTGPIPALAGMSNLAGFEVSNNQLTGPVPALAGLSNLHDFEADNNELSGTIPPLAGLSNLQIFYVSNNQLSGTIPSLTDLTHLWGFNVGNNQLRGDVPGVPSPNALNPGSSTLCPNALIHTPNADWDAATGQTPWYQDCDSIFSDGFDG